MEGGKREKQEGKQTNGRFSVSLSSEKSQEKPSAIIDVFFLGWDVNGKQQLEPNTRKKSQPVLNSGWSSCGGKTATESSQDEKKKTHWRLRVGCRYQISVDEAVGLQVLHALADVLADTQQRPQAEAAPPLPEEVQQAAVLHELCDDVNGLLLAANPIQLHQLRVGQFPGWEKTDYRRGCTDKYSPIQYFSVRNKNCSLTFGASVLCWLTCSTRHFNLLLYIRNMTSSFNYRPPQFHSSPVECSRGQTWIWNFSFFSS